MSSWLLSRWKNFNDDLLRPVPAVSLGLFRILFGFLMVLQTLHFWPGLKFVYDPGSFHFYYRFFSSVKPWPAPGMDVHVVVMGVAAAGIMLGLFYRVSTAVFLFLFAHLLLMEYSEYQNHYYLIILLSFLFLMTDANRWGSLDRWRSRGRLPMEVPYWQVFIFKMQFLCVYLFSGIAKLNPDWLQGEPMRYKMLRIYYAGLPQGGGFRSLFMSWIYPVIDKEWFIYFLSYGGLLYDIAIGFLLFLRKTRWLGIILCFAFSLATKMLFGIGVFPWLMMASVILFGEPGQVAAWFYRGKARQGESKSASISAGLFSLGKKAALFFVYGYLLIQIMLPLRHRFLPGNHWWTGVCAKGSWEMLTRTKQTQYLNFWVKGKNGSLEMVDVHQDLNPRQAAFIVYEPWLIWQYAQFLKERSIRAGVEEPLVMADIVVSLNSRPYQHFIDANVNLAQADYPLWGVPAWVLPLQENVKLDSRARWRENLTRPNNGSNRSWPTD